MLVQLFKFSWSQYSGVPYDNSIQYPVDFRLDLTFDF